MKNALLTPDGYFFEQLPNGLFTDGDGMVVAAHDGDAWVVTDQSDSVGAFDTLRAAIMCAQQQLATNYPEIYENHVGEL